ITVDEAGRGGRPSGIRSASAGPTTRKSVEQESTMKHVIGSNNGRTGGIHKPPGAQAVTLASAKAPDAADAAEVPPLSAEDQAALASFGARQQVIKDLTLGCINGNFTGAHISGPPGVSKTHSVVATLREQHAYWRLHQKISAKPLFLELA